MTPPQTLNRVELIKGERMSHIVIISPVEHPLNLLPQQYPLGVWKRSMAELRDVKNLRNILRSLSLLKVWHE